MKKMLLYSFILSPQNCTQKETTTKNYVKSKKKVSPALETLLNERKKNPVLMKVKKNLFVFFAHIF